MLSTVRIWFMDNVWDKLFPPDETQRVLMAGSELEGYRRIFGLSVPQMAKYLMIDVKTYKKHVKDGIWGPGDDGSKYVMVKLTASMLLDIKDKNQILDELGYKGKR